MVILLSIILSFYHVVMQMYRYSISYFFSFFCPIFLVCITFFLYKYSVYRNIIWILICIYAYYLFYIDRFNYISTKIQEKSEY